VRNYALTQEPERSGDSQPEAAHRASEATQYIAPYTPAQNGLCDRFIGTFKDECTWQRPLARWQSSRRSRDGRQIHRTLSNQRTHSALNGNTPRRTYLIICKTLLQQAV